MTVVLLHGWPGLPSDYDQVVAHLSGEQVIVPDLAGFGAGFTGTSPAFDATAAAHAGRLLSQLDETGVTGGVVIGGYDIGSRIAQAALRADPDRFDGAVLTPAYPGIGDRAASPALASTFWYQHFHREPVAAALIDGDERAVRTYLTHIWETWRADAAPPPHLDEIVAAYARPGAFAASLEWYTANRGYSADEGPITVPTTMLWAEHDPLFPVEWADNLPQHFSDVHLEVVPDSGHFVPVERPDAVAKAIRSHLR
ncbi:pimeloyl-ACP methyl ester carboxylesterase [Microbacterium sp. SORGH_AS 505]|uniref:alpha/beta fold hydrolase n=1 Tax=Microbacterium sp. SORGH_AS_0505 TaxID=3041770 RepID=UPI002788C274|nr:alpha/beta hydrolase [Microbacterium sp. SORGH_AS_0505]MDQ1126606.1 pimeloyl-ACP methyl ester carboxylesterase [Microbacterium sp. SORGH_AS_0505]